MFHNARIKLTAWYLLIIMIISGLFSVEFYHASTREIQYVIERMEMQQERLKQMGFSPPQQPHMPFTIEELEAAKNRIKLSLIVVNAFIFVFAGGAGYFLAGRTLRPIKVMIDEQNQFISSASHELRTPIATMRAEMEASLLEKNISDKEARRLIKSNLEELTDLQNLSNTLLRLAKVHNTGADALTETVDLSQAVANAKKKVASLAKKKHITITSGKISAKVTGEKNSLTEVFVILFDNAIKYSPEKTAITIDQKKENASAVITIKDQGIGIAAKDLPHIFDRFYRADKSRNEEGYGLGLSIAKKIIETHNGEIRVTSKVNSGTTFLVSLPLKNS